MPSALPKPRRARRTWPQRLLLVFNVFVVTACLVTAGGLYYAFERLNELPRISLAHALTSEPDTGEPATPQNFLLVGSDSRADIDPDQPDFAGIGSADEVAGQRSDTIMVLRVEPATNQAAILSFPRDLWVDIHGRGSRSRINEAFASGADVLIETIEENFAIPIHHYVEVDFNGFKSLVDAIGGVDIPFPAPARDANTGLNIVAADCVRLDGEYGLAYARSRHYEALVDGRWKKDPLSDLNRIQRQQDFIRRAMVRAVDRGIRNPAVLNELLDVATESVKVDDALTVRDMVRLGNQLRNFDPATLRTETIPNTPAKMGGADVLLPDMEAAEPLLELFRSGLTPGADGGAPPDTTTPVEPADPADVTVKVLNGSGVSGLARSASETLGEAGFQVAASGDAERFDYTRTVVRYVPGQRAAAEAVVAHVAGGAELQETPSLPTDVVLVLGRDFTNVLPEPVPTTVAPPTTEAPTPTTVEPPPTTQSPFLPSADAACG